MLDQSRDRVATLDTLKLLAEDMAILKINELQLYCEHTFAYIDRDVVWAGDDALRPEEILELDAFCRDRRIDLVPTMNSLGHLHKWLEHPEYADLAENYPYVQLPERILGHAGGLQEQLVERRVVALRLSIDRVAAKFVNVMAMDARVCRQTRGGRGR